MAHSPGHGAYGHRGADFQRDHGHLPGGRGHGPVQARRPHSLVNGIRHG